MRITVRETRESMLRAGIKHSIDREVEAMRDGDELMVGKCQAARERMIRELARLARPSQ